MKKDAEKCYKREGSCFWTSLGQEAVIYDVSLNCYYGLNASGALLWKELSVPRTKGVLVECLRNVFQLDEAQAWQDLGSFLDSMLSKGLVEEHSI